MKKYFSNAIVFFSIINLLISCRTKQESKKTLIEISKQISITNSNYDESRIPIQIKTLSPSFTNLLTTTISYPSPETATILKTNSDTPIIECNIKDSSWDGHNYIYKYGYIDSLVQFDVINCQILNWQIHLWYSESQWSTILINSSIQVNENNFIFRDLEKNLTIQGWFNTKKTCYGSIEMPRGYINNNYSGDKMIIEWSAKLIL